MTYDFIEHTGDIKFQARSNSLEGLFIQSATALNETMFGKITILEQKKEEIKINAKDFHELLHNFLEEFLFLLDAKNFITSKIESIKIDKTNLTLDAILVGDEANNYKFTNDVKAITYSEMFIKEEKGFFTCQVVLDV